MPSPCPGHFVCRGVVCHGAEAHLLHSSGTYCDEECQTDYLTCVCARSTRESERECLRVPLCPLYQNLYDFERNQKSAQTSLSNSKPRSRHAPWRDSAGVCSGGSACAGHVAARQLPFDNFHAEIGHLQRHVFKSCWPSADTKEVRAPLCCQCEYR
jgi:hypothetical protein